MARMMGLLHDYLDGSSTGNAAVKRYGTHKQRQAEKHDLNKEIMIATPPRLDDDHWGYYYEGLLCGVCGALDDDNCTLEC